MGRTVSLFLVRTAGIVCAGMLLFAAFGHAHAEPYDGYGLATQPASGDYDARAGLFCRARQCRLQRRAVGRRLWLCPGRGLCAGPRRPRHAPAREWHVCRASGAAVHCSPPRRPTVPPPGPPMSSRRRSLFNMPLRSLLRSRRLMATSPVMARRCFLMALRRPLRRAPATRPTMCWARATRCGSPFMTRPICQANSPSTAPALSRCH